MQHPDPVRQTPDTERGTKNGAAYEAVYRYAVTYIHRDDRWVALAEHLVEVPKAK